MITGKVVPIVRASGEGEKLWFYGGGLHIWKATTSETGGAFLLFEDIMSRGKTTPLHTHPEVDETLYVLEGEILLHIDGEEQRVGSGGVALAPRGVAHAFLVTSETARILFLETPGTSEAFYRGASPPHTTSKSRPRLTSHASESRQSVTEGSRSSARLHSRWCRTERAALPPQLAALLTSLLIFSSTAAVSLLRAKEVGQMSPSSRFAASWKPSVAYLDLNFCPL